MPQRRPQKSATVPVTPPFPNPPFVSIILYQLRKQKQPVRHLKKRRGIFPRRFYHVFDSVFLNKSDNDQITASPISVYAKDACLPKIPAIIS
jgi:hypothetical protein